MRYKTMIFDIDGTLTDSATVLQQHMFAYS